jgi:hypothetical protein
MNTIKWYNWLAIVGAIILTIWISIWILPDSYMPYQTIQTFGIP